MLRVNLVVLAIPELQAVLAQLARRDPPVQMDPLEVVVLWASLVRLVMLAAEESLEVRAVRDQWELPDLRAALEFPEHREKLDPRVFPVMSEIQDNKVGLTTIHL